MLKRPPDGSIKQTLYSKEKRGEKKRELGIGKIRKTTLLFEQWLNNIFPTGLIS